MLYLKFIQLWSLKHLALCYVAIRNARSGNSYGDNHKKIFVLFIYLFMNLAKNYFLRLHNPCTNYKIQSGCCESLSLITHCYYSEMLAALEATTSLFYILRKSFSCKGVAV